VIVVTLGLWLGMLNDSDGKNTSFGGGGRRRRDRWFMKKDTGMMFLCASRFVPVVGVWCYVSLRYVLLRNQYQPIHTFKWPFLWFFSVSTEKEFLCAILLLLLSSHAVFLEIL
jgi:hypothetical protein